MTTGVSALSQSSSSVRVKLSQHTSMILKQIHDHEQVRIIPVIIGAGKTVTALQGFSSKYQTTGRSASSQSSSVCVSIICRVEYFSARFSNSRLFFSMSALFLFGFILLVQHGIAYVGLFRMFTYRCLAYSFRTFFTYMCPYLSSSSLPGAQKKFS